MTKDIHEFHEWHEGKASTQRRKDALKRSQGCKGKYVKIFAPWRTICRQYRIGCDLWFVGAKHSEEGGSFRRRIFSECFAPTIESQESYVVVKERGVFVSKKRRGTNNFEHEKVGTWRKRKERMARKPPLLEGPLRGKIWHRETRSAQRQCSTFVLVVSRGWGYFKMSGNVNRRLPPCCHNSPLYLT
jgi:hypothetical protein